MIAPAGYASSWDALAGALLLGVVRPAREHRRIRCESDRRRQRVACDPAKGDSHSAGEEPASEESERQQRQRCGHPRSERPHEVGLLG